MTSMSRRMSMPGWLLHPMDRPVGRCFAIAAVPLWLSASIPLAFLSMFMPGLPNVVRGALFVGPQYLFGFSQVVRPEAGGFVPLFSDGVASVACAASWLSVTAAHVAITWKWKASHVLLAGLMAVVATALFVHLGFDLLGYAIELDAP